MLKPYIITKLSTARANQASVIAGTMTDEEFLASLPVAPVV